MTESKLKKYVDKSVKVYFRHGLKPSIGIIQYKQNIPACDYVLYQGHNSSGSVDFYISLKPKMIGHIREVSSKNVNP